MHVLREEVAVRAVARGADRRYDIGHKPVIGIFPALADHALRSEIDDVRGLFLTDQIRQGVEIGIQIALIKPEICAFIGPAVGKECAMRFG